MKNYWREKMKILKKSDGSKWKPTKLDFYIHEKMRMEKKLEELKIKTLRGGGFMSGTLTKLQLRYEKKIKELEHKIEMEKMKQP